MFTDFKHTQFKNGVIINADCLDVMPLINDKVDMILADLPYGTTACKWDSIIPFDKLWVNYNNLIKNNSAIVLTASQPFTSALVMSNINMFKYEWIWNKKIGGNIMNLKQQPYKIHENVLVFSKTTHLYKPIMTQQKKRNGRTYSEGEANNIKNYNDLRTYFEKYPQSIINVNNADRKSKFHPTQKPVELFEYLIRTYTNENDLVLDNTAGSMTTAIACIKTNRRFICIEKDAEYYEKGVDRVKQFDDFTAYKLF